MGNIKYKPVGAHFFKWLQSKVTELQASDAELAAVADGSSGGDKIGLTTIPGITGATVQAVLEWLAARLQSETNSASGADFVAMTPVSVLGAADTVQEGIEALTGLTYRMTLDDYVSGNLTAAITARELGVAHAAGTIVRAGMQIAATGADASDPLSAELDVLIEGVSIFTTKPVINKSAANGVNSFTAATGVTVGVIDATKDDVTNLTDITYTLTPTRTTPETEISGIKVIVDVAYPIGT